jgi:carbon storage regulator
MLVLSRKEGERVFIGNSVVVTIVRVQGDRVRIGVEAPADVPVMREELLRASSQVARDADFGRAPHVATN